MKSYSNYFEKQREIYGELVEEIYKGTLTIDDTYFYNSGISSIALNSTFNGPFLYKPLPSLVSTVFSMMNMEGKPVVPYTPSNIGGLSYPVYIDIKGSTKFFDYKESSNIDLNGLIKENISLVINEVFDMENDISIDTIFPVKPYLLSEAKKKKAVYYDNNKEYINIPIAYYGGGLNLSVVNFENLANANELSDLMNVQFMEKYLVPNSLEGEIDIMSLMKDVMLRCVTIVTGFEPFKFVCVKGNGYLYGETPKVSDLIANAKGE